MAWASLFAFVALVAPPLVACGGREATPADEVTGVPECDQYVARYQACLAKATASAGGDAGKAALRAQAAVFRKAAAGVEAKARLAEQCRRGIEAIRPTCGE